MNKQKLKYAFAVLLFFCASRVIAQTPDNNFGTNGKTFTQFGNFYADCHSMLLLTNGKIVSVGENGNSTLAILISQHNSDGTLDTSFNSTGKKQIDFGSSYEYCNSVKAQSDNKLVVAGSSNGNAAIARLLPNGNIDSSFSNDGKMTVSFGSGNGSSFKDILIQPDGKILCIGEAYNGTNFDFCAVRFFADGMPDSTYGTGGKVLVNFNNFNDFGRAAFLQNDLKIVIVGGAKNSKGNSSVALLRLTTNGSLDNTFGSSGKVVETISNVADDYAEDVVVDNTGSILIGGYAAGDFLLMKFNSGGSSVPSFGTAGKTITDFDKYQDKAYALDIDDKSGSIYLAGRGWEKDNGGLMHYAIAKYTINGNLDNTFDNDGKMTIVMGDYSSTIFDIAIQTDGKLLLGGTSTDLQGGYSVFSLLRLLNSPTGFVEFHFLQNEISFYPNPANDYIYFKKEDRDKISTVKIYSSSGQLILQKNICDATKSIEISTLPAGQYLISLSDEKGTKLYKFIKM